MPATPPRPTGAPDDAASPPPRPPPGAELVAGTAAPGFIRGAASGPGSEQHAAGHVHESSVVPTAAGAGISGGFDVHGSLRFVASAAIAGVLVLLLIESLTGQRANFGSGSHHHQAHHRHEIGDVLGGNEDAASQVSLHQHVEVHQPVPPSPIAGGSTPTPARTASPGPATTAEGRTDQTTMGASPPLAAPSPTSVRSSASAAPAAASSRAAGIIDNSQWYFPPRRRRDVSCPSCKVDFTHDGVGLLNGPGITVDSDVVAVAGAPPPAANATTRLGELMPCFTPPGSSTAGVDTAAQAPHARPSHAYSVVLVPVGCFGGLLGGKPCTRDGQISCRLGYALADALQGGTCAAETVGAFTGDNFYPSGVKARDARFDFEVREKFTKHAPLQMPWYAMTGNHDKRPHHQLRAGQAAILYARRRSAGGASSDDVRSDVADSGLTATTANTNGSLLVGDVPLADMGRLPQHPFWHMPRLHHASAVHGSGDATVQFFFVDSHMGPSNAAHMAAEAEWLDDQLRASTARWKVVLSHEPVFSFMGFTHASALAEHLHPVLLRHRVALYVCAHQHSMSLHRNPGGYFQFVAAGFSDNLHTLVKPRRPFGYYHVGRGAASVAFNATHAVVIAFAADHSVIFAHAIDLAHTQQAMGAADLSKVATRVRVPVAELATGLREPQTAALGKLAAAAVAKAGAAAKAGDVFIDVPVSLELQGELEADGFQTAGVADVTSDGLAEMARETSPFAVRPLCAALLPAVPSKLGCPPTK